MKPKTGQLKNLTDYFLEKYGSGQIAITDYWDADLTAVGLTDTTGLFTVYIADNGTDNFYISLEYPPTSNNFPYTHGEDFHDITADEVERILVKHLNVNQS